MRRSAWGWAALALVAPASEAAEGKPAQVAITMPSCPVLPFERGALLELLAIELRTDGVERVSEADAPATAMLHIEQPSCEAERVLLVLEDRTTGKTVGRGVDLGSVETASRTRFLALSGAELLRASWLELLVLRPLAQDTLSVAVRARVSTFVTPRPVEQSRAPALDRSAFFAGAVVRGYPSTQGGLIGGVLGGEVWLERTLLRLDLQAHRGEAFDPAGDVALTQGLVGVAWLLATAPGSVWVAGGPRLELGVGWGSGSSDLPDVKSSSGSHAVVSASAQTLLRGALSERWDLFATLEAGMTFVGLTARADGRKVGGIYGPFVATSMGVALR